MKKIEKIIILLILIVFGSLFFIIRINREENVNVVVKDSNDNVLLTFNIYEDNYYELKGKYGLFHIEVKDGKCRAIDVDCPNQICVNTGWISADNPLPIVCLPNGIVVQIYE